jgi:hypothetical protein
MHTIAARLGFDVVSLRLELFGRRRGSGNATRPALPDASQGSGTDDPGAGDTTEGANR